MSLNRYAKKRDANEGELVRLAEQLGAVMVLLSEPVDYLCGYRGRWTPTEIKNPDGRNRPTEQQIKFGIRARAYQLPVWTWRNEDDVMACLGARRSA